MAKKISERGRNEETSRNFRKEAKGSEKGIESGERGGGVLRTTRVWRKRLLVGAAAEAAVGAAGAVAVAATVAAASPGAGIATAAVRVVVTAAARAVVTAAVRRLGTPAAAAVTNSAV